MTIPLIKDTTESRPKEEDQLVTTKNMFRLGARAIGDEGQYVPCGMQMGPQGH